MTAREAARRLEDALARATADDDVVRVVLTKIVVSFGGPADFGARPDEHRFRIDNYWKDGP